MKGPHEKHAQVPGGPAAKWISYYGFSLNPVVYQDRIYVGGRGTYFYALTAETGEEAWSVKVGTSCVGSPAAVTDNGVYFGLSDGKAILGYIHSGGEQTTLFKTGSLVFAQPENHRGQLIIGSLSGQLFRLDTASGKGEQIKALTDKTGSYQSYFNQKARTRLSALTSGAPEYCEFPHRL